MEPTQNTQNFMGKKEVWIGIAIIIIAIAVFVIASHKKAGTLPSEDQYSATSTEVTGMVTADSEVGFDIKNRSYTLASRTVSLTDGMQGTSSSTRPNAVLLEGTAFGYLNSDNVKDAVVIVRDEPAGTQDINYYLVALLGSSLTNGSGSATTSNAVLLGNAIRIKEIDLLKNAIEVTTLQRAPGQALTVAPSITKTTLYTLSGTTLTALP